MKRTLMISGAFAAALALPACGEKNEVVEDGPVENASAQSGVGSNPVSNAAQRTELRPSAEPRTGGPRAARFLFHPRNTRHRSRPGRKARTPARSSPPKKRLIMLRR